jgi:hypothetical protein
MQTPADGFSRILETLDRLEIPYMMAGSAASSLHGIARPTMNIDLVADLRADQVEELVAELKVDFYADREMIREALARGRSFDLIHYPSSFKFDIFLFKRTNSARPSSRAANSRKRNRSVVRLSVWWPRRKTRF